MTQVQRRAVRGMVATAGMALVLALTGCGNFFVCDKASCPNSGGGSSGAAGNVAYVSNNVLATTNINGYTLGKTTLTAATKSPYPLGLTPTAMVVSPNNAFLYVASALTTASPLSNIFGFSIGTGGAISLINGVTPLASQSSVAAMDVSPDGQWLVVATGNELGTGQNTTVTAYPINTTTGLLSAATPVAYQITAGSIVSALKVAPTGDFVTLALASGGIETFPFTTSATAPLGPGAGVTFSGAGGATLGAYDVAIDANNLLYVALTGEISVLTVSSQGVMTTTPVSNTTTASGGPFSLALDGTSYLYASAATSPPSSLIYAFSLKSGTLSPLSTATISAPATTTKLAVDSTGSYLLAAGYDASAGLKMYSIASGTGVLTSLDTAPTGTTTVVPSALALSH